MPLLFLIPVLVVLVVLAWALLLPFSLWARYRTGRARRQMIGWLVRANGWLALLSTVLFLASATIAVHWFDDALRDAALGLAAGVAAGALSLALARFEQAPGGLHVTPNRWVVLLLTLAIGARIALGLWWTLRAGAAPGDVFGTPYAGAEHWLRVGGWFGIGGALLGYPLAWTWGLRARLRSPRTMLTP